MGLNTATVSLAVTPTIVSRLFSHYLDRKPLRERPTAHLSYDEGLHLIRTFLVYASHHTVEEVQAFTAQWVPHPQWIRVEDVTIPDAQLIRAATLLEDQLGPDGIRLVGGRKWWQWRKPQSPLHAEWIEMKSDYNERKRTGEPLRRVMLYVHGGAYFFGSVDEHRYQMQRHARKLKARVLAPNYRLAPQFPFPCGLQDCIAAYLHLLATQDPSTIIFAGDSAGGGMVLSMLVVLRDRGIPLPAGAVLISPWVDLTHSFPSVSLDNPLDYIPSYGFHHRPSAAWPPPTEEVLEKMDKLNAQAQAKNGGAAAAPASAADAATDAATKASFQVNRLTCTIDGKEIELREQIQMYATNEMLNHPLVSPVLQPTLGGLPPLLITTGGGEILRDEQIYLAHKCANPAKYASPDNLLDDKARAAIQQYKPTDVQLQVWEDLCHVPPTLSFTRPAKYMFRSIAQFGAWALARAQKTEIEILDDDQISIISSSSSDSNQADANGTNPNTPDKGKHGNTTAAVKRSASQLQVGKAGDPLPHFRDHMIRQRVTRHGDIYNLESPAKLAAFSMDANLVGIVKKTPVTKWLKVKNEWDTRYASHRSKVYKRRLQEAAMGFESFGPGEYPPPSSLAARRTIGVDMSEKRSKSRNYGIALWSLWGSKHDEATMIRENKADQAPEVSKITAADGQGSRPFDDIKKQEKVVAAREMTRSRSRRRAVRDQNQTEPMPADTIRVNEDTSAADLIALGRAGHAGDGGSNIHDINPTSNAREDTSTSGVAHLKTAAAVGAGSAVAGAAVIGALASGSSSAGNSGGADSAMDLTAPAHAQEHEAAAEGPVRAASAVKEKEIARDEKAGIPVGSADGAADTGHNSQGGMLAPDHALDTGVTGKRAFLGGIAMPFSLKKEPDTASMLTLHSMAPSAMSSTFGIPRHGASASGSWSVSGQQAGGHDGAAPDDDDSDDGVNDDTIVADNKTETGVSIGAVTALERNDGTRSERLSFDSYVTASELPRLLASASNASIR